MNERENKAVLLYIQPWQGSVKKKKKKKKECRT